MPKLSNSSIIIRDANRKAIRIHANYGHEVASTHSAARAEMYRQRAINGLRLSIKTMRLQLM